MTRRMLPICIIMNLLFAYIGNSQNLVPNPSFEELRNLPVKKLPVNNFEFERKSGNKAFKNHLNYWFSASRTTPDLRILTDDYYGNCIKKYRICDQARTGKNVVAIITYMENENTDSYREYLEIKLKKELTIGVKTYVELWIKSEQKSKLVSNNIGFYFSNNKIYANILEPLKLIPQINHDSLIRRSNDSWVKIKGTFIPDKAFGFLTIGNFYNNENTSIAEVANFKGNPFKTPNAYYIIDDVRVWQEGDEEPVIMSENFKNQNIEIGKPIILNNVEFSINSSEITETSFLVLDKLIAFLKESPITKIEISGHTDNIGDEASNLALSINRAKAIFNYLEMNGINKDRMSYNGYGESKPIKDNSTESGRKSNRRVEFIILEAD